jgi:hypothetical protein
MANTGQIVNGVCNATLPPNSECPAPTIEFYAKPSTVHPNATSTLYWTVTGATTCALSGGLTLDNLSIVSQRDTDPITQTTNYLLTCITGLDGTSAKAQVQIKLIPTYKEI